MLLMGALKSWHVLTLLCCLAVVAGLRWRSGLIAPPPVVI
jgi:hypothetical protein